MGSLVFQATLGGQVNLNGPNTASTFDIAVPATTGTMVTTGDSGTVTNTMLAASAYNTPGAIGSGTANTGAFTTLSASSTVSGTGFSTYLASPPAIGGTAAAAGTFTTLSGTTSVTTPIVKSASSLTFQTNGTTTAVTVDTSQNVGIGNTAANVNDQVGAVRPLLVSKSDSATTIAGSQAAIVIGNSDTTTSNTSQLSFAAITGANATYFTSAAINCIFGARTNAQYPTGQLTFSTSTTLNSAPTEKMRIDSSGNVGIGTSSPAANLEVKGASGQNIYVSYTSGSQLRLKSDSGDSGIGTTGATPLLFLINNAEKMRIDSSGNFDFKSGLMTSTGTQNNTTAAGANMFISAGQMYRSTSSLKYKKNVENATHGLVDLLKLRPVTYEGKAEADDGKTFGGLIAEEVHEAGLTEFVQYAEDGSPDALAYGNMVSLCVKAIQEQQALITSLTARIAALEAK